MKYLSLTALLIMLSLHFAESTFGQIRTAEQELKQLDSSLDDAFLRGDKQTFARVLADEMIMVSSQGDISRKKDLLSQIGPLPPGLKISIATEDTEVLLFGDTGVVSSRKIVKQETSEGVVTERMRQTNTYVRRVGRWQLVASQQVKLPAPYSAKEIGFDLDVGDAPIKGSDKAKVVLIEFGDYQCPLCRGFAADTLKRIEKEYIDTGQLAFVVRHTPQSDIHPLAFKAAAAAQCSARQGKFWEMNDRLFAEPMTLTVPDLMAHAQTLKLDVADFRRCLSDDRTTADLQQQIETAKKAGAKGTPIFLIGLKDPDKKSVKVMRLIQGAQPFDVFKTTLDTVLTLIM